MTKISKTPLKLRLRWGFVRKRKREEKRKNMENYNNKLKFKKNFLMADDKGIFVDLNKYTYGDNFKIEVNNIGIKPSVEARNIDEDIEIRAVYDPEGKFHGMNYLIGGEIHSYFSEDIPQAERLQRDIADAVEILKLIKDDEFSKEKELVRKEKYMAEKKKNEPLS